MILLNSIKEFCVSMFVIILLAVEYWFLFEKANEDGWKALIPCYDEYIKHKIVKLERLFWVKLAIVGAMGLTATLFINSMIVKFMGFRFMRNSMGVTSMILALMFMVEIALLLIVDLKKAMATAKKFGKSTAFGLGLAFLEPIFVAILAFDDKVKMVEEDESKEDVKHEVIEKKVEEVSMPIVKEVEKEEKAVEEGIPVVEVIEEVVAETIEDVAEAKKAEESENQQ